MAQEDPVSAQLTVLFDRDCGFCARCATLVHRLDRQGALRFIPLQSRPVELAHLPSEHDLLASMHVRDVSGTWSQGGAAWLRIAEVVPALRPMALVGRLPLARWWIEVLYRLVARNRHRLSQVLGLEGCSYRGPGPGAARILPRKPHDPQPHASDPSGHST